MCCVVCLTCRLSLLQSASRCRSRMWSAVMNLAKRKLTDCFSVSAIPHHISFRHSWSKNDFSFLRTLFWWNCWADVSRWQLLWRKMWQNLCWKDVSICHKHIPALTKQTDPDPGKRFLLPKNIHERTRPLRIHLPFGESSHYSACFKLLSLKKHEPKAYFLI